MSSPPGKRRDGEDGPAAVEATGCGGANRTGDPSACRSSRGDGALQATSHHAPSTSYGRSPAHHHQFGRRVGERLGATHSPARLGKVNSRTTPPISVLNGPCTSPGGRLA